VAGATFSTTPWVLRAGPAAPNYAVLQYFPLIILLSARPALPLGAACLVALVVLRDSAARTSPRRSSPLGVLESLAHAAVHVPPGTARRGREVAAPILVRHIPATSWCVSITRCPADGLAAPGDVARRGSGRSGASTVPSRRRSSDRRGNHRARDAAAAGNAGPRDLAWRIGAFWTTAGFVLAIRPRWQDSIWRSHSVAAQLTRSTRCRIPERSASGRRASVSPALRLRSAPLRSRGVATKPSTRGGDGRARARGAALLVGGARPDPWTPARTNVRPVGIDAPLATVVRQSTGPLLELPAENVWAQAGAVYRSIHRRPR
jgi:hypothetical protein